MRLFLFCILLGFYTATTFAQDPLAEKMEWYKQSKTFGSLFVHFDKNVYANNETIWFTGYLLKSGIKDINKHKILSVSLIRDIDSSVVVQDRFLMQDGISFGNMLLPDSLLTGDYHLLGHTDITIKGKPEAVFFQAITIKTNIDPSFKANMKLMESANAQNGTNKLLLSVTSKEGSFLPKPTKVSYRYGNVYQTSKTDASSQLLISLPPQKQLKDPNIYVKLNYGKDSTFINMPIPQPKAKASVKFYPEGGNMINGLYSKIAWEAKDEQDRPLSLKAFLFKDDQIIDTIETSSYGIGKFKLVADQAHQYSVKLVHSGLADSTFILPKPIVKGLVMDISNAIAQDTLRISLSSNNTRNITIRVHNFRESFLYIPFDMEYNKRVIKIPLTEVPKGLNTVTITDSLDRPLAERMFFAHYNPSQKIKLSTDQAVYKQREKVELKLNLTEMEEQAVVSIACVQDNRLALKKITDIESYTYLNQELGSLPLNVKGNAYADKEYMEQILLVKGWRRYTWPDLQSATDKAIPQDMDSLKIKGQVNRNKKELGKEMTVGTMGGNSIELIPTANKGSFDIQNEQLIADAGKKMFLFVNDKNKLAYEININDPYLKVAEQEAKKLLTEASISPSTLLNNSELVIKGDEKTIRLKEIVVTNKKDNSFNFTQGLQGSNACGDYVCRYNILNCPNHVGDPSNTQPIAGKTYASGGRSVFYAGCTTVSPEEKQFLYPINGIHLHKEFYLNDYKEPLEPAFFSTLYWNYATLLQTGKEATLSFYTSDIKGKFRVVVQGVSNKGVVYADQFFEVKGN